MFPTNGVILTNAGIDLISRALSESIPVVFTTAKIGTGDIDNMDQAKNLKDLKNTYKVIPITSISRNSSGLVKIRSSYTNKDFLESVQIKEIGIFAKVSGVSEVLMGYVNDGIGELVPPGNTGNIVERIRDLYIGITEDAKVTAIIDGSVIYATIYDLEEGLKKKSDVGHVHQNATITVSGFMSSGDKEKLDGVETGANKYIHPDTINIRHVSDTEKANWNSKEPAIAKKSGFNLEKTDAAEDNTTKLFTAKGAFNLFNSLTASINNVISNLNNHIAKKVSPTEDGHMIAADKAKLNGIDVGANNYTLPAATPTTIGGVKPDNITTQVYGDGIFALKEPWRTHYKLIGNVETTSDVNLVLEKGNHVSYHTNNKWINLPTESNSFYLKTEGQGVDGIYGMHTLFPWNETRAFTRFNLSGVPNEPAWTPWEEYVFRSYFDTEMNKKFNMSGGFVSSKSPTTYLGVAYNNIADDSIYLFNTASNFGLIFNFAESVKSGSLLTFDKRTHKVNSEIDTNYGKEMTDKPYVDSELEKKFDKTGGVIKGNVELQEFGNFIAPNNRGLQIKKTDGTPEYAIWMDTNNTIRIGWAGRSLISIDRNVRIDDSPACALPIGAIQIFYDKNINPAELYPDTVWQRTVEGVTIRGCTSEQNGGFEGGRDTVPITQAHLPSYNMTAVPHYHTRGDMNITGGILSPGMDNGAFYNAGVSPTACDYSSGGKFNYTDFNAARTWSGGTSYQTDATVPSGGGGQALNVTNSYIGLHIWRRIA